MPIRLELQRIGKASNYLGTLLRSQPEYEDWLWNRKQIFRRYPLTELYEHLKGLIIEASGFEDLLRSYRRFKQLHFLRIGGRDLLGWADLVETTGQLSDLAHVTLQVGLETLVGHPRWWMPKERVDAWRESWDRLEFVVMGLGKLGGHELNYASDVDLLFLYTPKEKRRAIHPDAPSVLNPLCQHLSGLLADAVGGDRVFQVDLRLRPQGKDGELVPSLMAASQHYLLKGRAWERQVLLKARPVAGDRGLGTAFLQEVRPFVFRRFLDFQALDELQAMRDRILAEGLKAGPGAAFDVKLGVGGIREVEFLVQSFQLIYGGRHPELDEPNTLRCLTQLERLGLLPEDAVRELREAYTFLRRVEHWVQLDQNRQTQRLPKSPEGRERLAEALGFEGDFDRFFETLKAHCEVVHGHFTSLFRPSEDAGRGPEAFRETVEDSEGEAAARVREDVSRALKRLEPVLRRFPPTFRDVVAETIAALGERAREDVFQEMAARVERYLGQVRRRSGLAKIFEGAALWVRTLVQALAVSEMVSNLLAHQPSLVEGVSACAGDCPDDDAWEVSSRKILKRCTTYEESVEWIRRLKNERLLMLALSDLGGRLDAERLEESLTRLADFVIVETFRAVREDVGEGNGLPLAILGLGKLGSREMGYLSDLDIMFVYEPKEGESPEQIPVPVVRLIQRFMRMISIPLQEGPGYAVDARLRPTGNYGPLVVTHKAWCAYYEQRADLWEIQALLRLRAVGGWRELGRALEAKARELCFQPRDPGEVWPRLCHLRQRMEGERAGEREGTVNLKLGYGGMADLEFLVQGFQLIHGWEDPALQASGVRRVLGRVAERLAETEGVTPGAGPLLMEAFSAYRALEQRLQLFDNLSTQRLTSEQFTLLKELGLWPPPGGSRLESWEDLQRLRRRVREIWDGVCAVSRPAS